jgi:alpha-glucosidase
MKMNIYHELTQKAAKHELMIFLHGAYTPTGIRRTWPNLITREGVVGNEYNKWSKRVTLEHTLTIPFTRMVPGPMDFTPGGFRNVMPEDFKINHDMPLVMGTRCRQLAMFVVYESPLQMVCDYPGAYRGQKGLDFIKLVPASWDETRCLAGEIGDYIVMARRKGDSWFIAAMTDEKGRSIDIPLDFLKKNSKYSVESWNDTPSGKPATELVKRQSNCMGGARHQLTLPMASGGGAVLVITPDSK